MLYTKKDLIGLFNEEVERKDTNYDIMFKWLEELTILLERNKAFKTGAYMIMIKVNAFYRTIERTRFDNEIKEDFIDTMDRVIRRLK